MQDTYKFIDTTDVHLDIANAMHKHGLEFTTDYKKFGKVRHNVTEKWGEEFITPRQEYIAYKVTNRTVYVNGDEINPVLWFRNSYDKTLSAQLMLGAWRRACWNGCVLGELTFRQRIIHRTGPTADAKLAELPSQIDDAIAALLGDGIGAMEDMAATSITDEQAVQVIGSLNVSDSVKRQALYRYLVQPRREADRLQQGNLWGLWNVVNEALRDKSKGHAAVQANVKLMDDINILAAA